MSLEHSNFCRNHSNPENRWWVEHYNTCFVRRNIRDPGNIFCRRYSKRNDPWKYELLHYLLQIREKHIWIDNIIPNKDIIL